MAAIAVKVWAKCVPVMLCFANMQEPFVFSDKILYLGLTSIEWALVTPESYVYSARVAVKVCLISEGFLVATSHLCADEGLCMNILEVSFVRGYSLKNSL